MLRHSMASTMLAEGADLAAMAAVLGHSNTAITASTYSHAINRTKVAAVASVAAAVGAW